MGYDDLNTPNLDDATIITETQLRKIVSLQRKRTSSVKTDDYTILNDDDSVEIILGSATAANKTFTFDTLTSAQDGFIYYIRNESDYTVSIMPCSGVSIYSSGTAHGIFNTQRGYIALRYDHTLLRLTPVEWTGKWYVEGLKLWLKCDSIEIDNMDEAASGAKANMVDSSDNHLVDLNTGGEIVSSDNGYSLLTNGTDEYLSAPDSDDWDIMGDKTDTKTVFIRVYPKNVPAVNESIIMQRESGINYWLLFRDTTNRLCFNYNADAVSELTSGGTLSQSVWHNVTLVQKEGDVGLYIDDTQVAFLDFGLTKIFTGILTICTGGGNYIGCNINDVFIAYQNIFNANPNVGLTDTLTIPDDIKLTLGK